MNKTASYVVTAILSLACIALICPRTWGQTTGAFDASPAGRHVRPYGPSAAWNIPIAALQASMGEDYVDPNSEVLSDSLWFGAPSHLPGNFNIGIDEYTYPVYSAEDATGLYPVEVNQWGNLDGEWIPWNPTWQPADGNDAQVIVVDPVDGREYNLFQVSFDGNMIHVTNGNLVMVTVRTDEVDEYGNPIYEVTEEVADYRSYEGGFVPSRGVGIQYQAMLVRPEEIVQGVIEHALSMPIRNPDGERFVAPATKLEHPDSSLGIPEGTRFAVNVTDQEIEVWLAALPPELPTETITSARIIARAIRDYGWFITDTAGGATFQLEWRGAAESEWEELGFQHIEVGWNEYPRDLLDGLLTEENIYAIVPSDEYGSAGAVEESDRTCPQLAFIAQPNPFYSKTTICLSLPTSGHLELTIYDATGRRVRTLLSETRAAGRLAVAWRGYDDSGSRVASGSYVCRSILGSYRSATKIVLLEGGP